ncbi:hypothetical protein PanWU01x14_347860 [Parasponia andersonii]|uniref:Uncharacterized protein n=1 Tax=Parasponia andersonii TaxID=3476 RepID=A0A2P5ABY3_PARAD|nr:hypothetical protein PanWU01x14_347860 [Parasponia andersonii]
MSRSHEAPEPPILWPEGITAGLFGPIRNNQADVVRSNWVNPLDVNHVQAKLHRRETSVCLEEKEDDDDRSHRHSTRIS